MATRSKNRKSLSAQPPGPATGRDWLWALILMLAVIVAYQPVWLAGFIWDDDVHVTANPCIVGPLGFKDIWTSSAADICPLTRSGFWVEHALWGLEPLPYHLVNVLLHGGCAILLWRVLRSLQMPGAWLGAALWALHPVEVESVAWITEMKNTQSGLFFLLAILFYLKWLNQPDRRTAPRWPYILTLIFAALAMASKSSTVILPVVLCLCAWWMEGRWLWRNLMRVAPIFLMAVAASALSLWTQTLHLVVSVAPQPVRSWPERVAASGDAVWFYLGKLLWPHPLIAIYPGWHIDVHDWFSYLPVVAVIIVLFGLWVKRESWSRPYFFVFAYFLAALLPVLGLVDNSIFRYSLVFDHFQYLASMGPLALAGAGLAKLASIFIPGNGWLQSRIGAGLLLILGMTTWERAWVYQNEETLWTDTVAKNPNAWLGYANLGVWFFQKGETDEAIAQYKKLLAINPTDPESHNSLGRAFAQKGDLDGAIAEYRLALELNPNFAEAHCNLGVALFGKGETDKAIKQYRVALALAPGYAVARNNLGNALAQTGHADEAMEQFNAALATDPNYAVAHNNLGNLLFQMGRSDKAIAEYLKALEIAPTYAQAHNNLGNAYLKLGRTDEAISQFQEILQLNPTDETAQKNLTKAQAARQAPGAR